MEKNQKRRYKEEEREILIVVCPRLKASPWSGSREAEGEGGEGDGDAPRVRKSTDADGINV